MNPNDPAFLTEPKVFYKNSRTDADFDLSYGLTKREYFSAMAMQGLLANSDVEVQCINIEAMAVSRADALIAELSKEVKA